jgi:uncharacterized protein YdeI (YjbR/CyaY-like superfamily)
MTRPTFFATEADFRRWLAANHETADELLVGFWKKATGKPSIDWPQARDQALCFGWIDGIRRSVDEHSYTIRFTPRRRGSIWSTVNVGRYEALTAAGQMTPAGVRAYEENKHRSGVYAYERETAAFAPDEEAEFRRRKGAWAHWEKTPPGRRKTMLHWVTSAKKPETRAKRLAELIEGCAVGRKIGVLETKPKPRA